MTVLFVVATILLFLGIDWAVRRARGERFVPVASPVRTAGYPVRTPGGIFFAKSHTWLNLFPTGSVRLGVDDFVARMLENPEVIFLKMPGETVRKGEPLFLLRENDHTLTIRGPIEGAVTAFNADLPHNVSWLKEKLFSHGWSYVIKPKHSTDLKGFLLGTETKTWIREEFARLRDVFAGASSQEIAPAYLQDGGPPIAGIMKNMDDRVWEEFDKTFLEVK
jgi:glycine cleavage system H lipoate-binding protein